MVALYDTHNRVFMEHYGYNITFAYQENFAFTFVKV